MRDGVRTRSVPQIIVSDADYERLTDLATASLERVPEVAQELLSEMDRAKVVKNGSVPDGVVRMGSTVTPRLRAYSNHCSESPTTTSVPPWLGTTSKASRAAESSAVSGWRMSSVAAVWPSGSTGS